MTKFLGKLVVMDVEGKVFHTTTDGKNKKAYTFEQIINCQHLIDNPGYNAASEAAHLNAKPESGTDRGAQPFSEESRNLYIANLQALGKKHLLLPGRLAKRIMSEMGGYEPEDACLAWWQYCDTQAKVVNMVSVLKQTTERDLNRNIKLNESRADCCHRIDSQASQKYKTPETEDARHILERAEKAGTMSAELRAVFEIRILRNGRRKGVLGFKETRVMPLYVAACQEGGLYRRDDNGNPIGIRTVLGGILQHHAHRSGKGSKASARAKTRLRLRTDEKQYRKAHGISEKAKDFPDAVPSVRKYHEQMNKELVRIFRDFSN